MRSGSAAGSAPVVGIDVDVAVRQVAGPHPRPTTADPDIDRNIDGAALHVRGDRRFFVTVPALAVLGDDGAPDRDAQAVTVGTLAGLADRHHDPAPVGVAPG